jgi:hypothetical protein
MPCLRVHPPPGSTLLSSAATVSQASLMWPVLGCRSWSGWTFAFQDYVENNITMILGTDPAGTPLGLGLSWAAVIDAVVD